MMKKKLEVEISLDCPFTPIAALDKICFTSIGTIFQYCTLYVANLRLCNNKKGYCRPCFLVCPPYALAQFENFTHATGPLSSP